jgi:hypothetical protein
MIHLNPLLNLMKILSILQITLKEMTHTTHLTFNIKQTVKKFKNLLAA